MSKQREEFLAWHQREFNYHPDGITITEELRQLAWQRELGWQGAQAAMQAEIVQLAKDNLSLMAQHADATKRIAELEERIRAADAEEPVAWMYSDEEGNDAFTNNPTFMNNQIYHGHLPVPLYPHAQIPAEVELKAKIAELESSEKEGWRYADELEQERKRLEAIIKEQP